MLATRTPRSAHAIVAGALLLGLLAGCGGGEPGTMPSTGDGAGDSAAPGVSSGPGAPEEGEEGTSAPGSGGTTDGAAAGGRQISVTIGSEVFTSRASGCHVGLSGNEFYAVSDTADLPGLFIGASLAFDDDDEIVVSTDLGVPAERSWTAHLSQADVTFEGRTVTGQVSFSGEHDGSTSAGTFEVRC
jgi:hypothetical protein